MEEFGPVQILVVGFTETNFQGQVMDELKRLTDAGVVRLVDLAVVSKDDNGDVQAVEVSGLSSDESEELGPRGRDDRPGHGRRGGHGGRRDRRCRGLRRRVHRG